MSENKIIHLLLGFLTAAGVNSLCPLELDPPRVFVKYGDSVSVNCSTSEYHDGMGWEARRGGTGLTEDLHVSWTVENLTDWTMSSICFINLNGTQCYETLSVVLFKKPDKVSISSKKNISGLMNEGEKHEINCYIQNVAPVQYLTVTWFKENEIIATQSFNDTNETPVDQSSILTITPDRSDNGTEYRCEATLQLGTKDYTVMSSKYPIMVQFGPEISCSDLEILEGQRLGDHCPVVGDPVPSVRWLKDGQPIDPSARLNRTGTGQYLIEAKGQKTIKKSVRVTVLYEPKLACPIRYRGLEHTHHSISCSVEGYPTPVLSWYKDGDLIDLPDNLTRNDAGEYLVVASNKISNASHTVIIEILYLPSAILELEDTEDEVGSTVVLKCSSTGYPRPSYSWSYYKAPNVVVSNDDGVSLLYVHNATRENVGSYTCHASNELGEVFKTATLSLKVRKKHDVLTASARG